jgi:hypothetical protein
MNVIVLVAAGLWLIILPIFTKAVCVHALKGLAPPRASRSGEVACTPRLRLRQSFSRTLLSQKQKSIE